MSAIISACGKYRYILERKREVGCALPPLVFVMLNPSTADASIDDPTIRRCRAFAKRDGWGGITVANLYAYRATSPKQLLSCDDPIGPDNDAWLRKIADTYMRVVCAWGANADAKRASDVAAILTGGRMKAQLYCLGVTKAGFPRHPLYVRGDAQIMEWKP